MYVCALTSFHVTDAPSVIINVNETCTTSITISLNTYSHPACGNVSHNVTISDNVTYPSYNITVTSTYNNGSSQVFTHSVERTSIAKCKFCDNCYT